MKLTLSTSPHIHTPETTQQIMISVFAALVPGAAWAIYKYGPHAGYVILTAIISAMLFEYLSQKVVFGKPVRVSDGSSALAGLLMAYCLPPDIPLWQVVVGSFFAIFITKECFGGLGFNIFNPALIGRASLLSSFPVAMTAWQLDGVTQATPLAMVKGVEKIQAAVPSYMDLLVGNIPGSIGEVSKILILLGGLFLLFRGIITIHIPFSFILTVAGVSFLFGRDPVFEILSGGILLGAFFMATDYVTSPVYPVGRVIFGFGCGLITVLIRNLGAYPEGVCYAILLMNMLVPLIERFTRPKIFGAVKA